MTTTTHSAGKKPFWFLPDSPGDKNIWFRELFFLFYAGLLAATFLYRFLSGSPAAFLFLKGAEIIYAPGMIFAAGCIMGLQDSSQPSFRKNTLKKAALCLFLYYGIGFCNELFINHRAIFATIKDLLAILRVPGVASVFLTLGAFFLICSFFWPQIEKCLQKPILGIAISILGFLSAFIPEGLLGYAITGVFVGGDRYGCIPAAQYLFVFFGGIILTRKMERNNVDFSAPKSLFTQWRLFVVPEIVMFAAGAVFAFFRLKQPAFVLIGSAAAGLCLLISIFLLPVYKKAEGQFYRFIHRLWSFCLTVDEKRKSSRKLELFLYFTGYTFLFIIVAGFIFFPYLQENRTLIWSVDGLGQYIPKVHRFMSYIPSVIQDILHGNLDFQQYDFTSGLGATVSISYDPIYWLYLLFNPSQAESAYSLMIILRYYLAGASMSALVLYFNKSFCAAYTASMVYAFSGYAIYAGTRHGQFLTPLILLPVLVVAMERLITKKKWYLLTILTGLSLLCSYYFLYMNTIALGIYFVARILCTKEYRNFKTFFTRGLIIAGSYVLGVSMGIISIFTSFGSYMGSSRTGGSKLADFLTTTPLFYRPEWISDFFISFISDSFTPGMWLKLGFAPAALLALVLLFTRKNKKELKPIFLIFTVFCIFPIFGFIFSGFSSVTNRWCYIYALLIAFILAENLENLSRLTTSEIKIMIGMVSLYAGIIFFSTKYRTDKVFGVFGLLMLTMAVLLAVNHDKLSIPKQTAKYAVFGITVLSVILNANLFITAGSEDSSHLDTYVQSGDSVSRMSKTGLRYLDKVTDGKEDEFYRSTNLKTYGDVRSSSLLYGYNDLSTFTSTLNGGIVDYNRAMGNCDWNIVSIYSYNFRTYMHELASVRYLGGVSDSKIPLPYGYQKVFNKKTKERTYSIYENQYTLPLGYTYDNILSESDAASLSAAQKQEATMLSAIVEDDALAQNKNITRKSSLPLTAKRVEITDMKAKGGAVIHKDSITVDENGGAVKFTFKGEPNAETYLSLKGDLYFPKDAAEHFMETQVKAKDVSYAYKFRIDSYSTGQEEFLFNLGYRKDSINTCTLKFKKKGTIKFEDIAIYSLNMDTYADRVQALKENVLEQVKTEKNTVTGTISTDKDKMLVITLPYQSGWTAWVDGEKTEIQKVNYQYMGLNLTPGTHEIKLHYQLPGLKMAFLITFGGIATFLFIIFFNLIRKRRRH